MSPHTPVYLLTGESFISKVHFSKDYSPYTNGTPKLCQDSVVNGKSRCDRGRVFTSGFVFEKNKLLYGDEIILYTYI